MVWVLKYLSQLDLDPGKCTINIYWLLLTWFLPQIFLKYCKHWVKAWGGHPDLKNGGSCQPRIQKLCFINSQTHVLKFFSISVMWALLTVVAHKWQRGHQPGHNPTWLSCSYCITFHWIIHMVGSIHARSIYHLKNRQKDDNLIQYGNKQYGHRKAGKWGSGAEI